MSPFLHLKLCLYYALQYLFFQYSSLIFFPNNSQNIKFSKKLLRILFYPTAMRIVYVHSSTYQKLRKKTMK